MGREGCGVFGFRRTGRSDSGGLEGDKLTW